MLDEHEEAVKCKNGEACKDVLRGDYMLVREENDEQLIMTKTGWQDSYDEAFVHDHRILLAALSLVAHDKDLQVYLACKFCHRKTHKVKWSNGKAEYMDCA